MDGEAIFVTGRGGEGQGQKSMGRGGEHPPPQSVGRGEEGVKICLKMALIVMEYLTVKWQ